MSQVLILAGDTVAVRSIMMSLQMEGFEPLRVTTGDDLLSRFNAALPAGVMVDLGAPWAGLSGLLRRLRAHGSGKKYRLMLMGEPPKEATDAALAALNIKEEDIFEHPVDIPAVVRRLKETPADPTPSTPIATPVSTSSKPATPAQAGSSTSAPATAASTPTAAASSAPSHRPNLPPLPRTLLDIHQKKGTGQLEVEQHAHGVITLTFKEGAVMGVQVASGRWSLAEMMIAKGKMTDAQRIALAMHGPISLESLVTHGLLAPHEILELGREQTLGALSSVVGDTSASCRWYEGRLPKHDLFNPNISLIRAVIDAYKHLLGSSLQADLKTLSPVLDADARDKLQAYGVLPFELRAVKELNGSRTVGAIVEALAPTNPERAKELNGFFNALQALGIIGGAPAAVVEEAAGPTDWAARKAELEKELERMNGVDPFGVLGVDQKVSMEAAKQRFFTLSKQYHPDRAFDAPPDVRELMENVFRKVGEAYEVVSNPKKREEYQAKKDAENSVDVRTLFQAEISFNQGLLFLKNGNIAKARQLFEEAVKLNGMATEYKVHHGWAMFLEDSSRYNEAAKLIHDALKVNPNMDKAFYYLGCIFKARNELSQAENAFKKAIGINPNNIEAQRELRLFGMRREKSGAETPAQKAKAGGLFGFFKK